MLVEGQLTQQTSYTVGVTIETGIDLGLDLFEIVNAGVSFAVSITTESGTTNGVTDTYPQGGWYCSLNITPTILEVSGTAQYVDACGNLGAEEPWTVDLPQKGSDGNPILNVEACTCQKLVGCGRRAFGTAMSRASCTATLMRQRCCELV